MKLLVVSLVVVLGFLLPARLHAAGDGFPQPESAVPCDEGNEPVFLSYGDHTTGCVISPAVDSDPFCFLGTAGDQVRIIILGRSDFFDPRLEIRDPTGVLIINTACTGNRRCCLNQNVTLEETGLYNLRVSDSGANETGSYTLQIEKIPPVAAPCLTYGSSVSDTISPQTDVDFIAFQGVAGTTIRATVLGRSDFFDPRLEILDPSGVIIEDRACTGNRRCSFSVEKNLVLDGTYFMFISDAGCNETGGYQINLECLFGSCPIPNPPLNVSLDLPLRTLSIAAMDTLLVGGRLVNGSMQPEYQVRTFVWIRMPDGAIVPRVPIGFQGVQVVPPGFDFSNPGRVVGTAGHCPLGQLGTYVFGVRLVDSETGVTLTGDLEAFTVVP